MAVTAVVRKTILATLVLAAAMPLAAQVKKREIADGDIERAIGEARRYLLGQQQADGKWFDWNTDVHASAGGGASHTSLALFALLEADGPDRCATDTQFQKGLKYLCEQKVKNTYVASMRLMVLSQVYSRNKDTPYKNVIKDDIDFLTKTLPANGGAWDYPGPNKNGDNSCSQMALLALWEAELCGLEVSRQVFTMCEATWARRQRADGGWIYAGDPDVKAESTASMTAAALASLYQCQDVLAMGLGPYQHAKKVDDGWKTLAKAMKDYKTARKQDWWKDRYLAFCVQRVGMASGVKFIDDMDWFADAATDYASPDPRGRNYGDKYGAIVGSSFELIFLARARLPMTYNKLEYGAPNQWNAYPRDVPRFTEFMRRRFDEMRMRWQVVRLADDVRLMLDAPILLMEGSSALSLSEPEIDKLREYTLRGGTLLMVANNGAKPFIESAETMLTNMYAAQREQSGKYYKLEPLPETHPLYGDPRDKNFDKIGDGPKRAPMSGVSDGTRTLAIVCHKDITQNWHARKFADPIDIPLGKNFLFYTTGINLLTRMRPVFIAKPGPIRKEVEVGWVKHEGNWCTSPFALKYLGEKINAENRIDMKVTEGVDLAKDKLAKYKLLWMTGSEEFSLSAAEMDALQAYINGGGVIFVNCAGGAKPFRDSAKAMLETVFANAQGLSIGYASANSSIMTGVAADERGPQVATPLKRTRVWTIAEPNNKEVAVQLYEDNGRIAAMFCAYGIHDTLDGHTAHGASSYLPVTARDLAANIVLTAMMPAPPPKPKKAADPPATGAASAPATGKSPE